MRLLRLAAGNKPRDEPGIDSSHYRDREVFNYMPETSVRADRQTRPKESRFGADLQEGSVLIGRQSAILPGALNNESATAGRVIAVIIYC